MSDEPPRFDPAGFAELPDRLALGQLPPGRHGLPRSFVVRNQRLRIVAGLLRVLPRHGYAETTIGQIITEARVSRAAFYSQFAGKEDCFLAAYDLAGEWLYERVERATATGSDWPRCVRAGLIEALRLLAANPPLAHLFAVDALQAGQVARERQRACLARLALVLGEGRADRPDFPPELDEMLLGGVLATIGRYVDSGRSEQLADAGDELLQYLLIPYLGPGESKRIIAEAA
jgi:AcrR family transcriptional regulator